MVKIRPRSIQPATKTAISAIWIVLGVASLLALGSAISIITGRYLYSSPGMDSRLPLDHLPQLLQAKPAPGYSAWLVDAPLWLRLICASGTVVSIGIFVLAGVFLRRVLQNVALGKPFSPLVLHNWKSLSNVLFLGAVLQGLLETAAFAVLYSTSGQLGHTGPGEYWIWGSNIQSLGADLPHWPWWTLLLGIVAQAIFVAFRAGAQLESDVTGLV